MANHQVELTDKQWYNLICGMNAGLVCKDKNGRRSTFQIVPEGTEDPIDSTEPEYPEFYSHSWGSSHFYWKPVHNVNWDIFDDTEPYKVEETYQTPSGGWTTRWVEYQSERDYYQNHIEDSKQYKGYVMVSSGRNAKFDLYLETVHQDQIMQIDMFMGTGAEFLEYQEYDTHSFVLELDQNVFGSFTDVEVRAPWHDNGKYMRIWITMKSATPVNIPRGKYKIGTFEFGPLYYAGEYGKTVYNGASTRPLFRKFWEQNFTKKAWIMWDLHLWPKENFEMVNLEENPFGFGIHVFADDMPAPDEENGLWQSLILWITETLVTSAQSVLDFANGLITILGQLVWGDDELRKQAADACGNVTYNVNITSGDNCQALVGLYDENGNAAFPLVLVDVAKGQHDYSIVIPTYSTDKTTNENLRLGISNISPEGQGQRNDEPCNLTIEQNATVITTSQANAPKPVLYRQEKDMIEVTDDVDVEVNTAFSFDIEETDTINAEDDTDVVAVIPFNADKKLDDTVNVEDDIDVVVREPFNFDNKQKDTVSIDDSENVVINNN